VMGDNLGYFIGRRVGTPLLAWLVRQRRFRLLSAQRLARSRAYFKRRTAWAIFITRFLIVVLGGPINLLAGVELYPYRNFLFWDVSGQILGAIIPLGLGYIFEASWEEAAGLFGAFSGFFLALLVALVLSVMLVRKIRERRRANAAEVGETLSQLNGHARHWEEAGANAEVDATLHPLDNKAGRDSDSLPIPD
jgi:membrane-associated protein